VYNSVFLLQDAYGSTCCSLKLTTSLKTFFGLQHEHAACTRSCGGSLSLQMFYVVITSI